MPRQPPKPYNGAWPRLRKEILERDGYRCFVPGCTEQANAVDHIIPLSEAPHLRLERNNLRATCTTHNTARENERRAALAKKARESGQWAVERAW